MTNYDKNEVRTAIVISDHELTEIVESDPAGFEMGELDNEDIIPILSEHFGVNVIRIFTTDDYEDTGDVWIQFVEGK